MRKRLDLQRDIAMANKYVTDEAKKQIGKVSEARTYDVERGAIRRFAEAISDSNPLFNSEREASKSRFGGMIAPPTFCRSMGAAIPDIKLDMPTFRGLDGGEEPNPLTPSLTRKGEPRMEALPPFGVVKDARRVDRESRAYLGVVRG